MLGSFIVFVSVLIHTGPEKHHSESGQINI